MPTATANLNAKITADDTVFTRVMKRASANVGSFVSSTVSGLARMGKVAAMTAGALGVLAAFKFVKDGIIGAAMLEKETASLEVLTGSIQKANMVMQQANNLATETLFELPELAESSRMLVAFGYSSETVVGQLSRMGDIAAGTGAPLKDLAYLFGTTRTQGRLFAKDLMQFTGRGIPMAEALSKVMGVSVQEINNMVTEGKIGFPEVSKALELMTSKGGQFFELMKKQGGTGVGLWNILNGTIKKVQSTMAIPILDKLKPVMQAAINVINRFQSSAGKIGDFLAGGINAAIGVFKAPGLLLEAGALRFAASLIEGVTLLQSGLVAAVDWFGENWAKVAERVGAFGNWLFPPELFTALTSALSNTAQAFGNFVIAGFEKAVTFFGNGMLDVVAMTTAGLIVGFNKVVNFFKGDWGKAILDPLKAAGSALMAMVSKMGEALKSFFSGAFSEGVEQAKSIKTVADSAINAGVAVATGGKREENFAKVFSEQRSGLAGSGIGKILGNIGKDSEERVKKGGEQFKTAVDAMGEVGGIIGDRAKAIGSKLFTAAGSPKSMQGLAANLNNAATAKMGQLSGIGGGIVQNAIPKAPMSATGNPNWIFNSPSAIQGSRGGLKSTGLNAGAASGVSGGAFNKVRKGDRERKKQEEALAKMDKQGTEQTNNLLTDTNDLLKQGLGVK